MNKLVNWVIHIIHVIRLDDARSDVSQNTDADDELKLSLSAVVIATIVWQAELTFIPNC